MLKYSVALSLPDIEWSALWPMKNVDIVLARVLKKDSVCPRTVQNR